MDSVQKRSRTKRSRKTNKKNVSEKKRSRKYRETSGQERKDQELKSILKTSNECKLTNKNLRVRFARGRPRISKIII